MFYSNDQGMSRRLGCVVALRLFPFSPVFSIFLFLSAVQASPHVGIGRRMGDQASPCTRYHFILEYPAKEGGPLKGSS